MNKNNIRYYKDDTYIYAEWGELSLDDDDREDGLLITVKSEPTGDARADDRALNNLMSLKYDEWIRQTR